MSLRLFELPAAFRAIADELDEAGGEASPDLLARLEALEGTLEEKARWRVGIIREREAEADAIKQEVARLKARADAKENAAKRHKADLLAVLQAADIKKLDVGIASINVQRASRPQISWMGAMDELPAAFVRVKTELDGTKLYESWKATGQLPDGFEVKHTTFLSIR